MTPYEDISYVSEPVMTIAIEPKTPKDLPRLLSTLNELAIEDPNLKVTVDKESGQYLLGGMGELHLEVATNFLKERVGNVDLRISTPNAAYRETILNEGALVVARSPNKLNRVSVQVEPLGKRIAAVVERGAYGNGRELYDRLSNLLRQNVWSVEEHANILTSPLSMENLPEDFRANVIQGFRWACRTGPLCEQPLRGIRVKLLDTKFDETLDNRDPPQIMRASSRAILGSFLTARPGLMEAIYRIEISAPLKWFGACSNMIIHRRGKIESTEKKDMLAIIKGSIPVAETLGLSAEMRSTTSGGAFWQLVFDQWKTMTEKLATETIRRLRVEKGLPPDLPKPEIFVDEIHR
jgi:elongation factor 2